MVKYKTPAALEMAVRNVARQSPMDTNRAIAGFYFHRLLCRVFSQGADRFVLKGGQSVLARTLDARVTRDIDLVAQEESLEEAIADLVQAASIDLDDFVSFVFDRAEQIKAEDEYRCGTKVWFTPFMGAKKLQPISIDLVVDEVRGLEPEILAPADRLDIEWLPVCDYRVCRVESALADKLLAMIELHDGRASSRIKDIVDILVYAKTCSVDGATLAERVENEASARKIAMPKEFVAPLWWKQNGSVQYAKMARQAGVLELAGNIAGAEEVVNRLYAPCFDRSMSVCKWNPQTMRWE